MECVICGSEIREKEVLEELREKNNHLLVKVRAEVCLNCGERYYASGIVDKLISLKESFKKRGLKLHEIGKVYELIQS
ncbi:MAG: hypothetical protein A3G37_02990 [Omnitrophica WOR_2 bacterium RIFCSPLOWO2_12_FULL_46_30]|nr:MAG: hypothetical protein A3G37_02990 [Omnitrophica WOR_2 bacterium RIFCSPLOWO2_12_FULL_46_30]